MLRKIKKTVLYLYHTSMRAHGKPRQIAMGMAIGVFAGLMPYAISQTVVALALATIFKQNRVSAAAGTWISNPFTSLPLYFLGYAMGALLLGRELLSYAIIKQEITEVGSFGEAAALLLSQLGLPIVLGTLILGAVLGVISYFITYQAVIAYRIRANHRKLERAHEWRWNEEQGWHRAKKNRS